MPLYRDAVYGCETVTLENPFLRLDVHKRSSGWGWGELFVPDDEGKLTKFMAVLEHLAEAEMAGVPHPLRLEASNYKLTEDAGNKTLSFEVELQEVAPPSEYLAGKSALRGGVKLTVPAKEPVIYYEMSLKSECLLRLHYIRGPWLRVGACSFGIDRHDAIFPGVEWVIGDEWSSGTDWFENPEALRVTPHPHKVAIPIMAISQGGTGVGLSWNPEQAVLSPWTRIRGPQPVFATPNFVDRRSHHLLGLMFPSARWGMKENDLRADPPILVGKGVTFSLNAQISVVEGTSLDVVVDWVQRNGMPDPGKPRYGWEDALNRIARAYNTNLWIEGKGWGFRGQGNTSVPDFVLYYIEHGSDSEVKAGLRDKVDWCKKHQIDPHKVEAGLHGHPILSRPLWWVMSRPQDSIEVGNRLLEMQISEGDFPYAPNGIHGTVLKDWAETWRPLGQEGDSAVDLCATAAAALILAGKNTGEGRFLDAARKTLDFALGFERPEGGDWWETPLKSPNLLAAGHAAIAYYLGYKEFGKDEYLKKAIRWIRSLIPFTHLWEPADIPMMYNTKPCFCSTCWFLSDWVSKHVQWEVLQVFAMSSKLGIDWAQIDPDIDWNQFQKGVTTAVLRWMIDHEDAEWMYRSEFPAELLSNGTWDTLFCDTFDPVNNTYGGGPIMPEVIADNILLILQRGKGK
ncbi:MAG: hypothetical protein HPY52_00290 [Firmicutes bacterium]|nr:hypothetical protein [Bacillota bacterium]